MVIKSLSRKSETFKQLFDYINKNAEENQKLEFNLRFNQSFLSQFIENNKFRLKRKNGIVLYHEILSFDARDKDIKQEEILFLAYKWLDLRAPKALSYGVIHTHQDNIHIHLMISANEIRSKKKIRLSQMEFNTVKKELEKIQIEKYPHMKHSICQQNKSRKKNIYDKEFQIEKNGKRISQKNILKDIIKKAVSKENFTKYLKKHDIEIYKRSKNNGIFFKNKKYRFATLGFEPKLDEKILKKQKLKSKTDQEKNIEILQKLNTRDESERDQEKNYNREL